MDSSVSHRPWEGERSNAHNQGPQTLPSISTLTANMNPPPDERSPLNLSMSAVQRDSGGNWANNSSSTAHPSTTSSYTNSSPNRFSTTPYSSDVSAGPQPSPGFSSHGPTQQLPSLNQNFEPANHRGSGDYQDSRRSSIDSRVHQSMDKLTMNPTSPYASNNVSQTSLVSGLQRERGIQSNGYRGPRYSAAGPSQMSPHGPRTGRSSFVGSRVAPPILENPKADVYAADKPTAGQAYAFPDPEAPHPRPQRPGSQYSRRNSYAESYTSSIFTTDSRLPAGQQELPDSNMHHHSLQHKQVRDIMDDEDSPTSQTPYSRTPELRVTHKLAERKRRSEMKGCFEQLRLRLPANSSNKSSKWETLSRAIDYITSLEEQNRRYKGDIDRLTVQQRDADGRIMEMQKQLQRMQGAGSYQSPPNEINSVYASGGYGNGADPPRTLPPLMNGAMQGVQYDDRR